MNKLYYFTAVAALMLTSLPSVAQEASEYMEPATVINEVPADELSTLAYVGITWNDQKVHFTDPIILDEGTPWEDEYGIALISVNGGEPIEAYGYIMFVAADPKYDIEQTCYFDIDTMKIDLREAKTIEIYLKEGLVANDEGQLNPEQTITLGEPGAITSITAERKASGVVTLNGVKVGDDSEIGSLNPGLYIINGKKVIKK